MRFNKAFTATSLSFPLFKYKNYDHFDSANFVAKDQMPRFNSLQAKQ